MLEKLLSIPAEIVQSVLSFLSTMAGAVLGRMGHHAIQVQASKRKFFSKHLFIELVIAISIAFFAEGVAVYFGLDGKVAFAAIVGISYIGPRGIEAAFQKLLSSKTFIK